MVVMSETAVSNYLENLLIRIETYKDKEKIEETKNEFLEVMNHYKNEYPSLIQKYQKIGNKILNNRCTK